MPSLLEALEKKYWAPDNDFNEKAISSSNADAQGAAAAEERLISIFIPRQSPLMCVPELLVLNDCDIDCAGDFESIKEKCQRVRELDLAQNKLQDWQEVFHIVKHMPRIEFLNLSKNHLVGPISELHAPTISNLRSIVLNCTYLDWNCVDVLLENSPKLEELHLSLNNYKEVLIDTNTNEAATATATPTAHDREHNITENNDNDNINDISQQACNANECCCCCCLADTTNTQQQTEASKASEDCKYLRKTSAHKALKTLHFTGNPIECWHEICRLGRVFPYLENLVLADCPIKAIYAHEGDNQTGAEDTTQTDEQENDCPYKYFPNLVLLNLSSANINTWDDIDKLAKFPKLENLRVKNWPLWERLECTEHERRQLLIARLPNVSLLNGGGVITADEREDAERAFIRHYTDKPVSERPKRYEELLTKHGKLDPLVNINLKPDKHVKVLIIYNDTTQPRLVDINRTVADLKVSLEKVVGLPANKMRLYYQDQDYKEFGPELMKYPNKLLYSYNLQAGDEIIVDEKK
ncbi:tubulin-specific chaperone cofactor E-like protein [Teleopsis dalmanni]|uniref:tubulin-specific chaperone cofactor E-like protein n=1 Tax=Teleopsis dalmanni TaxID=139649 RepID=UPI0018CE2E65|nr:tubulin-specific chaperone cofactor E-like protein [Teleopsis dalmanni]XP_037945750.1 tubulin-specific chaperone cofactor E-like protein [Teleopsis dalmanni]